METETYFSDEALGQEVKALLEILEMLPSGVLVVDAQSPRPFCNRAARDILGSADAACAGPSEWTRVFGWFRPDKKTLLSPDELPAARILQGEEISDELMFVRNAQRPTGVWIRINGKPTRGAGGVVEYGLIVFRDVTEGKLSQQTGALLAQVVEQIADAVFLTDKQGFIEYVNPAFETMTGFSHDDVRGKTPRILKSGMQTSDFYRRLWDQLLGGHVVQSTVANRRKTGEIYHVEETVTPITDEAGNLTHFVAVMQDISEALQREEREVQLRLARQVQQKFYRLAPRVPGFDVAAAAYPAYETSGDYFDFIPLPHHRLGIAVGDVEGHGFGSALVMALTRAYIRSFASLGLEVDQILSKVNRMLTEDLGNGCFVTMMLVSLDVRRHSLVYASAGHVPGYLLNSSGFVEHTLESSGIPLGLFPEVRFSRSPTIALAPGHMMVLLTDGITESSGSNDVQWGAKGALDYIRANRSQSAGQLVDGLYREALRFTCNDPQKDDITSVIIKANPAGSDVEDCAPSGSLK